ncbi:MAG TPA: type II toxin-antitoxin system VapC family toxin [Xanthobacteraceae bacterium]|jgi:tRNA(fMet)-specific endonuclease VapC|nr:type II toxin-antitoxin system VapC family toxin [Xanthobacteraceae bacterium]
MICLDTNVVIVALNQPQSLLRARLNRALVGDVPVAISSIVLFELWYGVAKGEHRSHNTARITDFLAGPIKVLNFDAEDARESGDIRAALARVGTPIGPYDVLIAAQARRRGAILVTANKNEFARVPGLQTQDWTIA